MTRSLSDESTREIMARLRQANARVARLYPGETGRRQPVHTVLKRTAQTVMGA